MGSSVTDEDYARVSNPVQGISAAIINLTKTPLINAQAGQINNITSLTFRNTGTATVVDVYDGNTVIESVYAPANATVNVNYQGVPLRGSVNSAISVQCGTTAAALRVAYRGYVSNA